MNQNSLLWNRVWKNKPGYHFKTDSYFGPYVYVKEKMIDDFLEWCERYGYETEILSKQKAFRIRWERNQSFTSLGGYDFGKL